MSIQGGFYFHPSDEDLSLGTPLRKKPTRRFACGYTCSGFALAEPVGAARRAVEARGGLEELILTREGDIAGAS